MSQLRTACITRGSRTDTKTPAPSLRCWFSVIMVPMFTCLQGLLVGFISLTVALPVVAASPLVNQPAMPYAPLAISADIETEQLYLGELVGDPHMYEVTLEEESEFVLTLVQQSGETPIPFSLIVVRDNDNHRGVTEVGRLTGKDIQWGEYYDAALALSFLRSETISYPLTPGVYRFEVSTPDNFGKYLLVLGTKSDDTGYFAKLGDIRLVQNFFDVSFFRMFISTYVLYPVGVVGLLVLIYLTWRRQRTSLHA